MNKLISNIEYFIYCFYSWWSWINSTQKDRDLFKETYYTVYFNGKENISCFWYDINVEWIEELGVPICNITYIDDDFPCI